MIYKFQNGGKTYKHNDYYSYINKIQEKAISNPQWFWSDTEDASQARQWLYDNGASAVVDNIYENTPENIQKNISYKNYLMLLELKRWPLIYIPHKRILWILLEQ